MSNKKQFKKLEDIINDKNLTWQDRFDQGFKCKFTYCMKDYYNPDTTYEEDITAYYRHVKEKREQVQELKKQIKLLMK